MKRTIILLMLLAFSIWAGTAGAAPVTVNFGSLGINSYDITNSSYTLDGVTFRYDSFGSTEHSAAVDAYGVFGQTYGALIFDISTPVRQVGFNFAQLGAYADMPDALVLTLTNGGSAVVDLTASALLSLYDPADPTQGGDALGSFLYQGLLFDQVSMIYALDTEYFSLDSLWYDTEAPPGPDPVPEPGTMLLLGCGLLGLLRKGLGRKK